MPSTVTFFDVGRSPICTFTHSSRLNLLNFQTLPVYQLMSFKYIVHFNWVVLMQKVIRKEFWSGDSRRWKPEKVNSRPFRLQLGRKTTCENLQKRLSFIHRDA